MSSLVPVVFTGARSWEDRDHPSIVLRKFIKVYGTNRLILIVGGAPGLDTIAAQIAREHRVHVATVDALWDTHHHAAGPVRNQMMLRMAQAINPDKARCVAFHWDLEDSRGTASCVKYAEKYGLPVTKIIVRKEVAIPSAWDDTAPMGKRARKRG
jgi:hypothetical protein